jgi:hypothetical protein
MPAGISKFLEEPDFQEAAQAMNVSIAAVKAVAEVESKGQGFYPSGRPIILFEAHIFGRYTNYKFNQSHPNLSSYKWNRALYFGGEREYERLNAAVQLNEEAALKSTSWGKFQICGFNHKYCGYTDVFSYVDDQYISEGIHLMCFVKYILSQGLDIPLRNLNWAEFARRYNGPKYAENRYDVKLQNAYLKYGGQ